MGRSTYALPALFTVAASVGLILALVRDGTWEWLALALVGAPIAVFVHFWLRARSRNRAA